MAERTAEELYAEAHLLSPAEFERLIELFEMEKRTHQINLQPGDPFLALRGTWSDGDVDEFNALIEAERRNPARGFSFDWDEDEV